MGKNEKPDAPQFDRFLETARALGCGEDKEYFEAKLGAIARHRPKADKAPKKCLNPKV
jgi:hypothetical protein